jgi:hypothetical protein
MPTRRRATSGRYYSPSCWRALLEGSRRRQILFGVREEAESAHSSRFFLCRLPRACRSTICRACPSGSRTRKLARNPRLVRDGARFPRGRAPATASPLSPYDSCCRGDRAGHGAHPPRRSGRCPMARGREATRPPSPASSRYSPLGVEPPESPTENVPPARTASSAWRTNSSAPARYTCSGLGSTRISDAARWNELCPLMEPNSSAVADRSNLVEVIPTQEGRPVAMNCSHSTTSSELPMTSGTRW